MFLAEKQYKFSWRKSSIILKTYKEINLLPVENEKKNCLFKRKNMRTE